MVDTGGNSNSVIHPSVQREIDRVGVDCERRHGRANEHIVTIRAQVDKVAERCERNQMALVELTGRSGQNGIIGQLREDVDELKKGKLAHLKASGVGATLGGGGVYGIIELIHWLTKGS